MKTVTIAALPLWHAMSLLSLTQMSLYPLNAQVDTPETANVRKTVLYQGPLV